MPQIQLLIDDRIGQTYQFENKITVGRDYCNIIQIKDQKVSRRHFYIEKIKGFFIIKDLGSQNGTFINQVRISESELQSGDRISIGDTILLFTDEPFPEFRAPVPGNLIDMNYLDDEQAIVQIHYKSLKDTLPRLNLSTQKSTLVDALSQMTAFASGFRPIESGSLLFQDILEVLNKLFIVERSYILLKEKGKAELKIEAFRSSQNDDSHPDFTRKVLKKVYLEGISILFNNDPLHDFANTKHQETSSYYNAMCVPIRSGMNILGMLYVDSLTSRSFSKVSLALLSALGLIAGTNICSWRSYKRLQIKSLSSLIALATMAVPNVSTYDEIITRLVFRSTAICEYMGLSDELIDTISSAAVFTALLTTFKGNSGKDISLSAKKKSAKTHPQEKVIYHRLKHLPEMDDILRLLYYRNANYDGTGLPEGLSGSAIPLGSRILRALIVFEGIEADPDTIRQNLLHMSGSVLDPMVVKALIRFTHSMSEFGQAPDFQQKAQDETDS